MTTKRPIVAVFLLSWVLCASTARAATLVLVTYEGVVTTFSLRDVVNDVDLDPGPFGLGGVVVGSVVSGSYIYDLGVTTDLATSVPASGSYAAMVSASFNAPGFSSSITSNNGAQLVIDDNASNIRDRFLAAVNTTTGGAALGQHANLTLNWATADLSVLSTPNMQVIPTGIDWELAGLQDIVYDERVITPSFAITTNLTILADLTSYDVTIIPEPTALTLLGLGIVGLLAFGGRRHGFLR